MITKQLAKICWHNRDLGERVFILFYLLLFYFIGYLFFMTTTNDIYVEAATSEEPLLTLQDNEVNNCKPEDKLAKIVATISQKESRNDYDAIGSSNEIGAYQILPAIYQAWSIQYFGDIKPITPANQDYIVRKEVERLLNLGLSVEQIALYWNSGQWKTHRVGKGYDTKVYVADFMAIYGGLK